MKPLIDNIENFVARIGKAAGYLNLILIVLIVVDVALRGLFSLTGAWVIEAEWHLFAIIFLLGIPYALQQDRHVRVDLFYERFSKRDKRLVNLVGTLIFLLKEPKDDITAIDDLLEGFDQQASVHSPTPFLLPCS